MYDRNLLKNAHKTLDGFRNLSKGKQLFHLLQKLGNRK